MIDPTSTVASTDVSGFFHIDEKMEQSNSTYLILIGALVAIGVLSSWKINAQMGKSLQNGTLLQ